MNLLNKFLFSINLLHSCEDNSTSFLINHLRK